MTSIIIAVGALNGFVLGGILLVIKNGNQTATKLFGGILILFALIIVEEFADLQQIVDQHPHFLRVTDGAIFLISPMLYLYTLILTGKRKQLQWLDLLHGIPFVLSIISLMPFYMLDGVSKLGYEVGIGDTTLAYSKAIPFTIYLFLAIKEIRWVDKNKSKEQFPVNNYRNIIWFKRFLFGLFLTGVVSLTYYILQDFGIIFDIDSDSASSIVLSILCERVCTD